MKRMTLAVSLFVAASALAGTIRVPDDYESVNDAVLAAGADDTVVVAAGDYPLSGTLMLTNGAKLTGAGAGVTTLYRPSTAGDFELVVINHAQSVLDGFTLTNGVATLQTANLGTGGVRVDADGGTIRNCRVAFCKATTFYANGGITINSADGHAENCEVDHCRSAGTLMSGGGITVSSGTVTGCFVHDNQSGKTGCGIYVGDKARVGECTVVRNVTTGADQNTGGIYINKNTAIVSNCVMWANMAYGRTATESFDAAGQTGRFKKCAMPGAAINGDCIRVDAPGFADPDNNDFTPVAGSPLIGAGFGGADIGAFPSAVTGFTVGFVPSADRFALGRTVTLTARLHNAPEEGDETFVFTITAPSGAETVREGATVEFMPEETGVHAVKVTAQKGGVAATPTVRAKGFAVAPATFEVSTVAALLSALDLAADGTEIKLAAGDYPLDSTLVIDKGVKLTGAGRDVTTLLRPSTTEVLYNVLTICHAEAVVNGLTVTGGKINASGANGVWIIGPGGRIEDCHITGNNGSEWYANAGGVYLITSGGVVSRCIVDDNTCQGNSATAGGIYNRCGRVDNCLIAGNKGKNGAGVNVTKGGQVRNCTIVNNTASTSGGGIYVDADQSTTKIVNCIIDSNVCNGSGDTSNGKPNWTCKATGSEKYFYTNATSAVVGTGTITDKPVYAEGGWSLDARSAKLIDHGAEIADIGDYDVVMSNRVQGAAIDVGCYEYDASKVECGIVWSPQGTVAAGETVTLTATGIDSLNPTAWLWTLTKPSGEKETFTVQSPTFNPTEVGAYSVALKVTTAGGDQEFGGFEALTVFPKTVYVAFDGSGTEPYDDRTKATTNIHDALRFATHGTTVRIAGGTFAVTNEIVLTEGVVLTGEGEREDTVLKRTGTGLYRVISLLHEKATVTNLTITGGNINLDQSVYGNYGNGGGALVESGTLTDCLVVSNANSGFYGNGCGIMLQGANGVVRRCEIRDNKAGGGYPSGGGVYMTAGTLENCLIVGNHCQNGGGVQIDGTGAGLVRNCSIVGNWSGNPPGGKDMACGLSLNNPAVTVVNCIVRGNDHTKYKPGAAGADPDKYLAWSDFHVGDNDKVKAVQVQSCCLAVGFGSDCVTGDPCFRSDWHIRAKSPCHDKGLSTLNDWARGTVDLDGKPRLVGYGIDMGCFENQSGGLQVILR